MIANPDTEPGLPVTPNVGGFRAGLTVLTGIVALNVGNYVFHLISARHLGPSRYSDLATLITLSSLVSLPLGGVQIWVARYVAQYRASGDDDAIRWFSRRVGVNLILIGLVATALAVIAAWPLQRVLGIGSLIAVALTALTVFPSIVTPVSWGVAQGMERFGTVALAYASGPVIRLVLVIAAFAAGAHVGGAMLATLASMLAAFAVPSVAIRRWFGRPQNLARRIERLDAFRSLVPIMIGMLAVTALTSDDVVVAKVALSDHVAGIYGSASLMGRVILYFPAAIVTVMLPRVAARVVDRRETNDLLARSIGVTVAFCVSGTLFYAAAGHVITNVAFGTKYAPAGGLLWLFGIAMSGFAVLNVLLIYHLARGHNRMSWLLLGGAIGQTLLFTIIHGSSRQLVVVDIAVAFVLILLHEALLDAALMRSLGAAWSRNAARRS